MNSFRPIRMIEIPEGIHYPNDIYKRFKNQMEQNTETITDPVLAAFVAGKIKESNRKIAEMEERKISLTDIQKEYCTDLYGSVCGFVKMMCGHNRYGIYTPAAALSGDSAEKYMNSTHLDRQNMMMSMSTFRKKGHATLNNILAVCCLAVDVDYLFQEENGEPMEPMKVYRQIAKDCLEREFWFPVPTYVEYGHRLRLVYVLDQPFYLPHQDKKKRRSVIRWMLKMESAMACFLNKMDYRYHAEVQQLTKFVRVPESLNIKFDTVYEEGKNDPHFVLSGNHKYP